MKFIFLTALLVVFTSTFNIKAQTVQQPTKLSFGLKTGLNASYFNQNFNAYEETNYNKFVRVSPMIGIFTEYKLSNSIALQGELLYSLKGGSYRKENTSILSFDQNGNVSKSYYYQNFRLNYLELPVLANVNFTELLSPNGVSRNVNFVMGFGVIPGINTTSKLRYNIYNEGENYGPVSKVSESYSVKEFSPAEKFQFSVLSEMAFHFKISGKQPAFINLRYAQSVTESYQNNISESAFKTTNTTFTLGFGLKFTSFNGTTY